MDVNGNDDVDDDNDDHVDIDGEVEDDINDEPLPLAVDESTNSCQGCCSQSYLLLLRHPPPGLCVAGKLGLICDKPYLRFVFLSCIS